MPYVFFGKLLRCQILASHGGQVTALALLTQLEEMADLWFDDAEDRAGAVRAITFVEINVLRAWHDGMPAAPDSPERAWCVERAEKLIAERFAEEAPTLLRLSDAIPIITSPKDTGPVQIEKGTVED